jgi:hypothetical protein
LKFLNSILTHFLGVGTRENDLLRIGGLCLTHKIIILSIK